MADRWITMTEACHILGVSQRTLHRRIKQGEVNSKLEQGRRLVLIADSHDTGGTAQLTDKSDILESADTLAVKVLLEEVRAESELLKEQLKAKDQQIDALQSQLADKENAMAEASHRHDTVVMQMTRLLEYHQQPFWRRWRKPKQLPEATFREEEQ